MDAVLIAPHPTGTGFNRATITPPIGLAYLAAVLEQEKYTVAIIDAYLKGYGVDEVLARIPHDVKLVGLSANSFVYDATREIAAATRRERPNAAIIIGGPLPSSLPERVMQEFDCDGLVRGEGEDAILQIMENIRAGRAPIDPGVMGGVFRSQQTGRIIQNAAPRNTRLDDLPFPAYHLLPRFEAYRSLERKHPAAPIITSRGCPHECVFCSKDIYGRRVTYRSAENVLAEIDHLVERYGVRQINVMDDNFALKRDRVDAILDGIIERDYGLAINLQVGVRTETLDEALLRKMKQAGVFRLGVGVESADPAVLELCRKRLDLAKVEEVSRIAKSLGMLTFGFFVVGLPGEGEAAFQRSMAFAKRVDFDVANFCMAVPLVGTELYRMVQENGRFLVDTSGDVKDAFYSRRVFFEYGDQREADILRRYDEAYRAFFGPWKKLRLLSKVRSWPELRFYLDAARTAFFGDQQTCAASALGNDNSSGNRKGS